MGVKEHESFELEEFTPYWNVDEKKFKELVTEHNNILVAGFPPLGNIIPYHLKELLNDSEKVLSLYSYNFPPMVEAREEEFEIPHDELWYSESKQLFCYVGKYPEAEYIPKAAYKQAEGMAHLAKGLGVRELYTVGVIMSFQEPFRDVEAEIEAYIGFFEGSKKEVSAGAEKMTRKNIGRYSVIRKTGLLPGFAAKLGIESYSILGVGKYPEDLRACAGALRAFKKMSGIELKTEKIEQMFRESAEGVEERMRRQKEKEAAYRGDGIGADASQYMYG
ncbi:MAG: PAC2 family protein [Halobacteriota archaeon]